ncbi:MAG: hypothetical protein WA210_13105 [Burkholderiaceae bacterium]
MPQANLTTGPPGNTQPPGGGTPDGGTTPPDSNTPPPPGAIVPTWYGVQANILQRYCTVCHSGANPPAGISWEVDQYAVVVTNGRMSTEIPTMREINPGAPDASYMIWKLRGQGPAEEAIVGVRMPAFSAALDPALIDVVTQWIRDGAPLGAPSDADSGGSTPPPSAPPPPPPDGGTTPPGAIVPTWYGVQANILQRYCTVCHSGANPPAGLSWEVGQYAAIVTDGRMSTEISTMREVKPDDPDASYMMWKLLGHGPEGQAIVGTRMPAGRGALDPALIDVVAQWIRNGAPLGDPTDADSGGAIPPPAIIPTWYGVQVNILDKYCTACHREPDATGGLSWELDRYNEIVTAGRMSSQIPGLREVEPGNPDASYMMWKIRGRGPAGQAIAGVRMPATNMALDPALAAVVEQWIRDGAPLGTALDASSGGTGGPTYPVGSWMYVWSEALQACSLCHSRTPSSPRCGTEFSCPPKDVVLTPDNYDGVVASVVLPFQPNDSKLWQRVKEEPNPAPRMPFGLSPLSERELQIIFLWIANGAPFCPANAVCP